MCLVHVLVKVLKSNISSHPTDIVMLDTVDLDRPREVFVDPHVNMLVIPNQYSDEIVGSSNNLGLEMCCFELRRL